MLRVEYCKQESKMNAARNTARILAHRWRLIGNIKQHPLLQRAEFMYLTYNQIRPFTLSSHCRQEAPVNGDEGSLKARNFDSNWP